MAGREAAFTVKVSAFVQQVLDGWTAEKLSTGEVEHFALDHLVVATETAVLSSRVPHWQSFS